jgi:hypothetical protein
VTTAFNVALGVMAMLMMGVRPGEILRLRKAQAAGSNAGTV